MTHLTEAQTEIVLAALSEGIAAAAAANSARQIAQSRTRTPPR
jgi:hypothetical protein